MKNSRSIDLSELDILQNKVVFPTTNEKHVLSQEYESVIREPEYRLLGFLNNYSYSNASGYITKDNLEGRRIAETYLEVEHGYFYEGLHIMYFTYSKALYCIDENLNILWQKEFDDYIRSCTVDMYGSCYVLFMNSTIIRKYLKTGNEVLYLSDSTDYTKEQRLYCSYISQGGGYLYVIGSSFYNYNKVTSFIDLYDTRKGEIIDHQILFNEKNVKLDDPYYEFYNIRSYGDYIYIYGKQYIKKINLKMIPIWEFNLGYNTISRLPNDLSYIEYDDSNYEEKIYFAEDLYDTKGHSIGLLSSNGKLIWKLENQESSRQSEFSLCVYKGHLYTTTLQDVNCKKSYLLSINDNAMYLQTHNNQLVKVVENDCCELYVPENYFGQRLLGSRIKEGVEKEIISPIRHDSGDIMVDSDYILLSQVTNENYRDLENYEYFYLLASERFDHPNDISILTTLNGPVLTSYFGSAIRTKEPYNDYSNYEAISDDEYNNIHTQDEQTIVRRSAYYSRNRYLIADRFKFFSPIITKRKHLAIMTKKHKFFLVRKSKYVYKYVLKKLTDIDIIVEFLEQNGIEDTLLPYYVDKLRHHTTHMIEDMQVAGAPNIYDIMAVKKFYYKYNGYEYPITTSNTQIYAIKNMPYLKRKDRTIFIDSMANLVINKEIRPFILFVAGKAIKWSNMVVVKDWYYTYIIIKDIQETNYNVESIILPCNIRYGEDNQTLPVNNVFAHLYFDEDGYITEDKDDIAIRVEVTDRNVTGETFELTSTVNNFQISTEYNQISSNKNIIIFEDNKLFTDGRFYLQLFGKNAYKYIRKNNALVKTFYYNKANSSKNILLDIPNQEKVNEDAVNRSKDNFDNTEYMDNFHSQFDFKLSRDKTYARNIAESTSYILSYHTQLLIDYYKDQANFKSYNYTGEELYKLTPFEGGYLKIPRQRKNGLDDYVIVFHNDKLYKYYKEIRYENRFFFIPIFNHVKREDKIEILHFKNIDNTYYNLTVTKDKSDYIAKVLRHDNFLLFGNSPSGKNIYDDFNVENNIQYELGFEYKNNWNGNKYVSTDIKLDDEYYYNKKINIVAKRQFRHMYYHVQEDTNRFELDPEFRFCRNKNQYLVFVDELKLINNDFAVEYMTEDNQIDMMSVITKNVVKADSYIHIIYIPDAYNEVLLENNNTAVDNADINLDTTDLGYPFDKDLFLVSIDGKKILNSNIQNINNTRVRLTHMDGPFKNICINSFLKPDAILKEIFSYGDEWSKAVDNLSKEDYLKLFKQIKK